MLQTAVSFPPPYYDRGKAVSIVPEDGSLILGSGDPLNGLVLGGTGFPDASKTRIPGLDAPAIPALFRGLRKETCNTDLGTIGPRLGFAYDVTGKQQTVLRGAGLFFSRIEGNYVIGRQNNPPFIRQATIYDANIENRSRGSEQPSPSSLGTYAPNLRVPRVANWRMDLQHKFFKDVLLDVAYLGSRGWSEYRELDMDQLQDGTSFKNPAVNVNALRPYPGYLAISQYTPGSNFTYHSLQVILKKQMVSGGLLTAAYTWSRSVGDVDHYDTLRMDSYHPAHDSGRMSYDHRHILALTYVYPLPFFRAQRMWYGKILGGWQLSGVTMLQSGLPLHIAISPDEAGIGGGTQRPDVIGDWRAGGGTRKQCFNTSACALPARGTFGKLGRNVVIGRGTENWDVSLQKEFLIDEAIRATFRTGLYNAPHHLSCTAVATTLGASNFGEVTGAKEPRTLQFALRLMF